MSNRYARQVALGDVGVEGQAKLAAARVLVVGLGGLGCPAALYLATSGVGRLVLNDFDRVDETNLPRQILYGPEDVGALEAAVGDADVVLDGTDNFATRFAVNRACVARRVPLVSGAAVRVEGQIAVFPNDGEGPCYACLYNDEDEWLGDCQGNGVLAPVPGVIGTLMAQEALKLVLGWPSSSRNRLLLWDAKRGDWQSVALKRDPHCTVCGAGAARG
jgi:molybdopterin/thiamine biosynthesis adenylyltransferase